MKQLHRSAAHERRGSRALHHPQFAEGLCQQVRQISWRFPKECPRSAYNTADVSYTYSTVKTVLIQNKLAVVCHRQV